MLYYNLNPINKFMINHQEQKINQGRQKNCNIIISGTSFQDEPFLEERARATIYQSKKELDLFIDQLDQKIRTKMEAGEVVFLKAYQNHLEKITKQLKVLKQTYDVQQAKIYADKVIINLGKQTILFRQEAIRLQDQLQQALQEGGIYRRKCQLLQKQIINTNKSLKKQISLKMKAELQIQKLSAQIQSNRRQIEQLNLKMSTLSQKQINISKEKQAVIKEKDQNLQQSAYRSIQSHLQPKQPEEKHEMSGDNCNNTRVSYPVFQIQRENPHTPQTPKVKGFHSTNRTRLKTNTTLEFNQSSKHFALFDAQSSRISEIKHLNEITKQRDLEQAQYRIMINKIIGFRKRDKKESHELTLQSKTIYQFFPLLSALSQYTDSAKFLNKQQSLAQAKKQQANQIVKIYSLINRDNAEYAINQIKPEPFRKKKDLNEINIIHKKAKIKNEVQKEKEGMEEKKQKSLVKMNQIFKKRKLGSKIGCSSFYLSARGIKDKWN